MAKSRKSVRNVHVNKYAGKSKQMTNPAAQSSKNAELNLQKTIEDIRRASSHGKSGSGQGVDKLESELKKSFQQTHSSPSNKHSSSARTIEEQWPEYHNAL